jgi:WXG100 family type VII secretion target
MTAENIQVNFGALQQSSQTLQQSANTLQGYVDNLLQSLQPLQNTWMESGSSAAEAMNTARTKLTNATDQIIQTITQFSTQVQAAHDHQVTLENQNTSLFT